MSQLKKFSLIKTVQIQSSAGVSTCSGNLLKLPTILTIHCLALVIRRMCLWYNYSHLYDLHCTYFFHSLFIFPNLINAYEIQLCRKFGDAMDDTRVRARRIISLTIGNGALTGASYFLFLWPGMFLNLSILNLSSRCRRRQHYLDHVQRPKAILPNKCDGGIEVIFKHLNGYFE